MCGIAGALSLRDEPPITEETMRRMLTTLSHRGPDAAGLYTQGPVSLGHARLSIIDVAGGLQPIANEDRTQWIVANGEAFNYVELGKRLTLAGHRFRTRSDTEVMLHLYEQCGTDFVSQLNGQFAFAIWDQVRRRLVLGRDRLGVRPLFYTVAEGTLLFASEIKALLADRRVRAQLDPRGLDDLFTYWSVLPGRTMFAGIFEVPAGHLLVVDAGDPHLRSFRYWEPRFDAAGPAARADSDEAAETLRGLLYDAVRIRLRSDVPVSAYLSGGLDSTAIAALARSVLDDKLQTFSVTFDDPEFDERGYQEVAARWLGTEHNVVHCRRQDIAEVFPDVIRHAETPLLRTAPAPLFLLSGLARSRGFKVALTGEGADEFLAGYDIFKEATIRRFWARDPSSTLRPKLLRRMYPWLPNLERSPQPYLEAFFRQNLTDTADPAYSHLPRWRAATRLKRLLATDVRAASAGYDSRAQLDSLLGIGIRDEAPLSQAQHVEVVTFLTPYLLSSQGDRMAMAHAVEGRFPFLDHHVIEFASALSPQTRMPGLAEKALLKKAVAGLVPPEILRRSKQPYRAPIAPAFFTPYAPEYVRAVLSPEAIAEAGIFGAPAVAHLFQKCSASQALSEHDNMAVVAVLSTQLWYQQFIRDSPASTGRFVDVVHVGRDHTIPEPAPADPTPRG